MYPPIRLICVIARTLLLTLSGSSKSRDREEHLIARGENVIRGEFPFVVLVWQVTDRENNRGYRCTGSLLAADWVLTAAHCVYNEVGELAAASDVSVYTGVNSQALEEKRTVQRIIVQPRYSTSILGTNDLALLQLSASLSNTTVTVLTNVQESLYAPSGSTSVAVGWGRNEDGEFPGILQKVSIPLYSRSDCQERLGRFGFTQAIGTFCAGTAAEGIRGGDSGGPLLVRTGSEWGQVGVASLGSIDPELVGFPGTYVQTSLHYSWIYGYVSGTGGGGGDDETITLTAPSLTATALGPHRVSLKWSNPNGDNAYGYVIDRREAVARWSYLVNQFVPSLEFIDGSASPQTTYSYRIRAYNTEDHIKGSSWSGTVAATTPLSPVSLSPSGRHIPHIAQGLGWGTLIHVLNTCDYPVTYDIDLRDDNGDLQGFDFADDSDDRYIGMHNGDDPMEGKDTHSFLLHNLKGELIQGYGYVVDNGGGCIAVDTTYKQFHRSGETFRSTIPLQKMTPKGLVFTLEYGNPCDLGVAIAGTGEEVTIEAIDYNLESMGSVNLGSLYHSAFSLKDKLSNLRRTQGQLRITGEATALVLEFCDGKLSQFQLPHYVP